MADRRERLAEVVAVLGIVALGLALVRRCAAPARSDEHWLHQQLVGPV